MPALPADIARYTSDGVLITLKDATIKDRDPDAEDDGDNTRDTFFVDPDDAQLVAEELYAYLSAEAKPHEAIETGDTLGLGVTILVFPQAPRANIIDDTRQIDTTAIVRAYSFDMDSDSYAIELVGGPPSSPLIGGASFDSTEITFDNDVLTWDTDVDA